MQSISQLFPHYIHSIWKTSMEMGMEKGFPYPFHLGSIYTNYSSEISYLYTTTI
jgi:hypothetical protein